MRTVAVILFCAAIGYVFGSIWNWWGLAGAIPVAVSLGALSQMIVGRKI